MPPMRSASPPLGRLVQQRIVYAFLRHGRLREDLSPRCSDLSRSRSGAPGGGQASGRDCAGKVESQKKRVLVKEAEQAQTVASRSVLGRAPAPSASRRASRPCHSGSWRAACSVSTAAPSRSGSPGQGPGPGQGECLPSTTDARAASGSRSRQAELAASSTRRRSCTIPWPATSCRSPAARPPPARRAEVGGLMPRATWAGARVCYLRDLLEVPRPIGRPPSRLDEYVAHE